MLGLEDVGFLLGVAGVFEREGRVRDAVSAYLQVLVLDENNELARRKLRELGKRVYVNRQRGALCLCTPDCLES